MRTRLRLAPLCLALALTTAACDDGDGAGTELDTTADTAADTATDTAADTSSSDTAADDTGSGETTTPDTNSDTTLDAPDDADADGVQCTEPHEQRFCVEPDGELDTTVCAAPDIALFCELRTSPDGCHVMGVWARTDCEAGESCVDGVGCVATPVETRGTCAQDADCPEGSSCLEVIDDDAQGRSWRTCAQSVAQEAEACSGEGLDECCSSAECMAGTGGGCFTGPLFYCGGAFPQPMNVCLYDACASDADCALTDPPATGLDVCLPRGAFGEPRARCDTTSSCRFDEDCASRDGGACLPFFSPCNSRFAGFHCTYDDSACRSDADCAADGRYCAPGSDGQTSCEEFFPPP